MRCWILQSDKEGKMYNQELVRILATRINEMVNIPLINEDNEQAFFELTINMLLQIFLNTLDFEMAE